MINFINQVLRYQKWLEKRELQDNFNKNIKEIKLKLDEWLKKEQHKIGILIKTRRDEKSQVTKDEKLKEIYENLKQKEDELTKSSNAIEFLKEYNKQIKNS